jgi:pyruvate/2-oxoglutarate dehydrogenase complex dihydrolipoamide acyltransferase (E2) component
MRGARWAAGHLGDRPVNHVLTSPQAATETLAAAFAPDGHCRLQVREERAFSKGIFLDIGDVVVPGWSDDELEPERALLNGEYEWTLPDVSAFTKDLIAALATEAKAVDADKARRIVDALGGVAIRLGLTHPVFDPVALSSMPFRHATTIISDTSGVVQGGLSFVAQNLHPAARLKVPSVVQMEIVNTSDRFMSNRRRGEKAKRYDMLMDHISSQAAQRVLLQLELRSSVELERTFLFGDPLRAAFKKDEEQDVKDLNLSVPVRSYADRLILEAARQHQAQVSPGHRVMLLTSDQGLARMAITEGLPPLYFSSAKAEALFGRTHTGSNLRPFDGGLTATSFAAILWELATIFGSARLCATDGTPHVTIHAIGDDFAWTPYQSQDDLLWMETHQPGSGPTRPAPVSSPARAATDDKAPELQRAPPRAAERLREAVRERGTETPAVPAGAGRDDGAERTSGKSPLYKMSVDSLFRLIEELDRQQTVSEARVMVIIDAQKTSGLADYRRFLQSGDAVTFEDDSWHAGPSLRAISTALANADADALAQALEVFPSFVALRDALARAAVGEPVPVREIYKRAEATFVMFAEVTMLGASVVGKGFFQTLTRPSDEEFARHAIEAFSKLPKEGGWASSGQWLEELIEHHGIHPLVARRRLDSASERGLVGRYFEGSTTDVKMDRHVIRVLSTSEGVPQLKTDYLYRGDFLMPGRGSSSLRIAEANDEPA